MNLESSVTEIWQRSFPHPGPLPEGEGEFECALVSPKIMLRTWPAVTPMGSAATLRIVHRVLLLKTPSPSGRGPG